MNLNKWVKEHTFHHSAFWDIKELVKEKKRQNLKISLCIPTLNEEATIGKEIVIFKSELMDRYPLLDEIAVIDSGSTDKTLEIAAMYGADTYTASEHLKECGDKKGKGENLWKALHILNGDIIVYVDADIKNIGTRFVTGLLGPLITNPSFKYVKGFYERPLASDAGIKKSGGGRVTELLIRPLFSLFFPELTGIIQPLSGEYAARREVLEKIPFPIGYGVETSMLIDIYKEWGVDVFAQTDLDRRVHRNQETLSLGKMAFGILQTFFNRLGNLGMVDMKSSLSTLLRQFDPSENEYKLLEKDIVEFERPPIIEIEEYRIKRGL